MVFCFQLHFLFNTYRWNLSLYVMLQLDLISCMNYCISVNVWLTLGKLFIVFKLFAKCWDNIFFFLLFYSFLYINIYKITLKYSFLINYYSTNLLRLLCSTLYKFHNIEDIFIKSYEYELQLNPLIYQVNSNPLNMFHIDPNPIQSLFTTSKNSSFPS